MRAKIEGGDVKRLSALRVRFGDHLQPALKKYTSLVGEVILASNSLHTALLVLLKTLFPDDDKSEFRFFSANEEMATDIWHSLGSDGAQRSLLSAVVRHSKMLTPKQQGNILWAIDAAGKLSEFRNDAAHTAFELDWDELEDPLLAKFRPSEDAPPKRVKKLQRIGHERLFKALVGDLNQLRDYITAIWIFVMNPDAEKPRPPDRPVLKSALLVQKNPPGTKPLVSENPIDKIKLRKRRAPIQEGKPVLQTLGYVAGATSDADLEMRVIAVSKARCHHIFAENHKFKLKRYRRNYLNLLFKQLQRGDTVVVFAFSTLADNEKELLKAVDELRKQGARLRSVSEPDIKPFTKQGRLILSQLYRSAV